MVSLVDLLIIGFAVATIAAIVFTGGEARHVPRLRLLCPGSGAEAECQLVQDVRTGQWKEIVSCSALPDPRSVTCDKACARRMNLGLRVTVTARV